MDFATRSNLDSVDGAPARRGIVNPVDRQHTVIPTPRSNAVFPGWGVRF